MTRYDALAISDALVEAGITHTIIVRITENMMPREVWCVLVTPMLTFSSTNITQLQRLADGLGCEISYCNGSFEFVKVAK